MTKSLKVRVVPALSAILLLAAPVALASGGRPKVPSYSGPYSKHDLKVEPAAIEYTGGGFFAGQRRSASRYDPLSWESWTSRRARGFGLDWVNSCRPSCSSGTLRSYPVKLEMWRPRTEGKHLVFTRMTLTFTGNRPPHVGRSVQHWRVVHRGRAYFWTPPASRG